MKMEDYQDRVEELQKSVSVVFEHIKTTNCPDLANTEWYATECQILEESLRELLRIREEFRRLQAEQYDLLMPEDQPEQIQGFDPSKYNEEIETQEQASPTSEIATAVAGIGAIINLFRKARG